MGKIPVKPDTQAVSKESYFSLAIQLGGRDSAARVLKKDPYGDALRAAGELYSNREFVPAYECLKPAHDKAVSDMQRVLARNVDFEVSRVAKEQGKTLAAAKDAVQNIRIHAQQVLDQFTRLMQDLEKKPLVRVHLQKTRDAVAKPPIEAQPTTLTSTSETHVEPKLETPTPRDIVIVGTARYKKTTYSAPEVGMLYCVRDKTGGDRIIRVDNKSADDAKVHVVVLDQGRAMKAPIELAVESLAKQALKGWCNLLVPTDSPEPTAAAQTRSADPSVDSSATTMRLDIQNFARCCADITRAKINFDTQRIKDVGDGPFRAGNYERSFLQFEQFATGFAAAVGNSRRIIADGRRQLNDQKGSLSGKEIQDRSAAFTRSEALIHTAEREFSTILEGLRMYLRAEQDSAKASLPA